MRRDKWLVDAIITICRLMAYLSAPAISGKNINRYIIELRMNHEAGDFEIRRIQS